MPEPWADSWAIEVEHLDVRVGMRTLLEDAQLRLRANKLTVLIGASGSGKSTLMRILAGLEPPLGESDRVWWSGRVRWHSRGPRHRMGMVFQQPALLDEFSPLQNVLIAIDHRSTPVSRPQRDTKPLDRRENNVDTKERSQVTHDAELAELAPNERTSAIGPQRQTLARRWLDELHIPWEVHVSRLSGGQRQRLSLAQSLASEPELVIFDEPTTGLDSQSAARVARLIRSLQDQSHVTSLVVTHDYESFLDLADEVLILDVSDKQLKSVRSPTREGIHAALAGQSVGVRSQGGPESVLSNKFGPMLWKVICSLLIGLGAVAESAAKSVAGLIPWQGRPRWYLRFFYHYGRLVAGGTALLYLAVAGGIIGFVTTYFTLKFMPYKVYTQPLLIEELLGAIGFGLYRILIPVLTTILVAARCAAAVAADLGNKRYGGQYESLRMLGVPVANYWLFGTLWSFLIGSILLNQIAFLSAKWTSAIVFCEMYPELGTVFWQTYFHRTLEIFSSWHFDGAWFVTERLLLCAFGTAAITYHLSLRPKWEATDVSRSITTTILWSTLWVLAVHLAVSLYEFGGS